MADDREISVKTPLGEDLKFARMEGEDRISGCFEFMLEMVSENPDIEAAALLGETVTVKIGAEDGVRFFHGHVTRFGLSDIRDDLCHYTATVSPWLWFLGTRTDCRIFQNMTAVEIIEQVFAAYGPAKFEKRLQSSYPPREYCVQYDETDLAFVQRLMEHEGIFYFFEYADGAHTMVLTDANAALKPVPGFAVVDYQPDSTPTRDDRDFITEWKPRTAVVTGAYAHTDYDFTRPAADLMANSADPLGHTLDDGETYSHPGAHLSLGRGDAIAAIRREELQAESRRAEAVGCVRGLWSGCTFRFDLFPREAENDVYVVVQSHYRMWDPQYRSGRGREGSAEGFEVRLRVAPMSVPYRAPRTTPRPIMRGPQTATVVGPAGEEIFTDEYSRVKVQFHWDRLGAKDEDSSCFVRVSSVWAGSGWGFIQIPRIGQEVIVDFIEGNPDHPIITGRVYNGANMPPYALPANATQSGWKSNSSPGGGGWNELRFEDRAGEEEVYFQAQKDHTELVKNDESRLIQHDMTERVDNISRQSIGVNRHEDVGKDKTTDIGNDRTVTIGNNDTETVGVNRRLTVGANETIDVGSNSNESIGGSHSQTVSVAQAITVGAARVDTVGASETRSVGQDRTVTVGGSQTHTIGDTDTLSVGSGQDITIGAGQAIEIADGQETTIGGLRSTKVAKTDMTDVGENASLKVGKKFTLEAGDEITLKCGKATIVMKKDGTIILDGKDITLKASGKITAKASGDVTIKGSKISQN